MKKNPKLMFVYSIFDTISKSYRGLFYQPNDETMVRASLPTVLMDYPLRDIEVYCIGTFDDTLGVIKPCRLRKIKTNCYLFPHSRLSSVGDDIPLEELSDELQKKKAEIVAKKSTEKEERSNE